MFVSDSVSVVSRLLVGVCGLPCREEVLAALEVKLDFVYKTFQAGSVADGD